MIMFEILVLEDFSVKVVNHLLGIFPEIKGLYVNENPIYLNQ